MLLVAYVFASCFILMTHDIIIITQGSTSNFEMSFRFGLFEGNVKSFHGDSFYRSRFLTFHSTSRSNGLISEHNVVPAQDLLHSPLRFTLVVKVGAAHRHFLERASTNFSSLNRVYCSLGAFPVRRKGISGSCPSRLSYLVSVHSMLDRCQLSLKIESRFGDETRQESA